MSSFASRLAFVVCLFATQIQGSAVLAQGTRSDYDRAASLAARSRGKVLNLKVEPHWFGDETPRLWYRRDLPNAGHQFILVDPGQKSRQPAFDHDKLAKALSARLTKEFKPTHLPFTRIEIADDLDSVRFTIDNKGYRYQLESGELSDADPLKPDDAPTERNRRDRERQRRGGEAPDRSKSVLVQNNNLILRYRSSGTEVALTSDGTADDPYDSGVHWSPDSSMFVALKVRKAETHTVHLIESSPKDQVQPRLHSFDYLKPGDRIAHPRVCLFHVPAGPNETPSAMHPANVAAAIQDELFSNPWSIDEIRWDADSSRFTFAYNQRGHQILRIIAVDAKSRYASPIVNEQSNTFIDYAGKRFVDYLDESNEILWMSERNGWNHMYLYDSRSGQVKNQVTSGNWVVRGVEHVDQTKRQITFRAGGVFDGQDPYYIHYGRVNFDGTGLTWLTCGDGNHSVAFSPDRRFLVDTYSRVEQPPIIELRGADDGSLVCELERADWSALLETGWKAPERFVAKGRDDTTDIYGVIWRPTNFDAAKKYPVIEHIYAGPHSAFTPKSFQPYFPPQGLCELGFIIVQMDGMGTSHRSKAFHDVCWKNLGDSGFPDRIAWIKAAAAKYPQMDISNVGIYGGSAGGQSSTRAMLAHADFYKVAVSDCGCHDNRMDKIWWNELWMGYPIGDHYSAQSNVTNANKLQGKLMLVVGELDRNVDPASTMQVINALVKADRDFDLLIIPGAGHGAAETPYGQRRRMDYFVRHLLGVEPRNVP